MGPPSFRDGHERRLLSTRLTSQISKRGDDVGYTCVQKVGLFQ
jgi:hypothetical protein